MYASSKYKAKKLTVANCITSGIFDYNLELVFSESGPATVNLTVSGNIMAPSYRWADYRVKENKNNSLDLIRIRNYLEREAPLELMWSGVSKDFDCSQIPGSRSTVESRR